MTDVVCQMCDRFVGVSDWSEHIRGQTSLAAKHPFNVLIAGPTGTGKELIAEAIHAKSSRSENPFLTVDCASLPATLVASELFGHIKGAFTGAHSAKLGYFRAAHSGTIFLDEIGELHLDAQSALLRVLQEKYVTPVGSYQAVRVDVRVIAATNRDLAREIRKGRFREDLFYRLNAFLLKTIPLRKRPEDIDVLVEHHLEKLVIEHGLDRKRFSPSAMALLRLHDWPGNVRELQHVVDRAVVAANTEVIGAEIASQALRAQASNSRFLAPEGVLPQAVLGQSATTSPQPCVRAATAASDLVSSDEHDWLKMDDLERYHIEQTLRHTGFNQSAAARLLGLTLRVLRHKIGQYGLATKPSKSGCPAATQR